MMRIYRDIYPNLKVTQESSSDRNISCCFWLVVSVSLVAAASFGIFAYHYYYNVGTLLHEDCPERLLTLKAGPRSPEGELWGYASFWSFIPESTVSDPIVKFAPKSLLANLEKTFKSLSLKPFENLSESCRKRIPSILTERPENSRNDLEKIVLEFPEDLGPLASPLFSADLSSEFQFHDHVSDVAQSVVKRADQLMKRRNRPYNATIPIYLSPITPEIEQFLSPDGEIDVRAAQRKTVKDAMADYRQTTNPLFLVMGDLSLMPDVAADDVIRVSKLPDPIALSVISSGNGSIINHGLLPTFGALLARTNVTYHAMNKTIIDAANNASLNWKATVVF